MSGSVEGHKKLISALLEQWPDLTVNLVPIPETQAPEDSQEPGDDTLDTVAPPEASESVP